MLLFHFMMLMNHKMEHNRLNSKTKPVWIICKYRDWKGASSIVFLISKVKKSVRFLGIPVKDTLNIHCWVLIIKHRLLSTIHNVLLIYTEQHRSRYFINSSLSIYRINKSPLHYVGPNYLRSPYSSMLTFPLLRSFKFSLDFHKATGKYKYHI